MSTKVEQQHESLVESKSEEEKDVGKGIHESKHKIEEVELKFSKPVRPFLPKLKSLDSAVFQLYPKPSEIQKNTVHQIWIQGEEHLKKARKHFYENFIEYKKIQEGKSFLWSEEMIESLIVHEYPEILTLYHSYSHFIMRVDLAKYIILHMYGGFYVDMDSECRLNFDGLAKMSNGGDQIIVCKVTDDARTKLYSKTFINNHFLYVPRRHHPFMDIMLREAPISAKRKPLEPMILYILRAVGPGFLMHCLKCYKKELNQKKKQSLSSRKDKLFYKKMKTEEIVTVVDSVVLNEYFFHESKNTWLEDQWMDSTDNNDYLLVLGAVSVFLGSATFIVAPYVGLYK
eukprot:548755_1